MAIDLSWLWEALAGVVSTIQNFFAGIWTQVQNITNTGQGIFSGLVAFGTQLWDAIVKAFTTLGEWLGAAFEWIYNGIVYWANVFGQWFNTAMGWIGSGVAWLGAQVYNFGQWLWNGIMYVAQYIHQILVGVWNAIIGFFTSLSNAFWSWWNTVATGINTWWTNLIVGIRSKIKSSIMASITITAAWKAGEKMIEKVTDFESPTKAMMAVGGGVMGIFGSVIAGALVAEVINAVIPTSSTTPLQIIPPISGPTIPSFAMDITPPSVPGAPTPGYPSTGLPTPPGAGFGLPLDIPLTTPKYTVDTTTSSKDKSLTPLPLAKDRTIDGRPISDIAVGTWTATPLYEKLLEGSRVDATYIQSALLDIAGSDSCTLGLSALITPPNRLNHKLTYTYCKDAAGGRVLDLTVRLLEGATVIVEYVHNDIPNTWTEVTQTLSEAEASAITDYGNLRIQYYVYASGGPAGTRRARTSYAVLEIPPGYPYP